MAVPPSVNEPTEDLPPELPAQGIGPHFEINAEGKIDLAPPEALDRDGNYLPTLRSLHPELREMAAALARRLPKGNNTHPLLGDRIAAYAALIDQDLAGVDFRRLYMAGLRLANALRATDAAIEGGEAPTLNAEAREEIDSVLEGHGPFIMASQAGREAVAAAVAYRRQPEEEREYRAAAIEFADALKANPEVITQAAVETVKDAAGDIGEGVQPERGTVAGQSIVRSAMITVIGGATIFALPAAAGGLIAGWAGATGGGLLGLLGVEALKKTKAFQDSISPVIRASDALSHGELPRNWAEFRAKLAPLHGFVIASTKVLRRLRTARFEDEGIERNIDWIERQGLPPVTGGLNASLPRPTASVAATVGPPPAFSQAAAEVMIRAGKVLPAPWWPHVTQLGLGALTWDADGRFRGVGQAVRIQRIDLNLVASLSRLRRLALNGMEVRDLLPVAGLQVLETLDLSGTQVSDLEPLRGLVSLRELNLRDTKISDLVSLCGLTSLQELVLNYTRVSDLKPLRDLASLRWLDLDGTQVSNLEPLRGLASLRWLNLGGTRVSDIRPLNGLSELDRLDLRGTKVSDIAPLSLLAGLRTLDLDGTEVRWAAVEAFHETRGRLGLPAVGISHGLRLSGRA